MRGEGTGMKRDCSKYASRTLPAQRPDQHASVRGGKRGVEVNLLQNITQVLQTFSPNQKDKTIIQKATSNHNVFPTQSFTFFFYIEPMKFYSPSFLKKPPPNLKWNTRLHTTQMQVNWTRTSLTTFFQTLWHLLQRSIASPCSLQQQKSEWLSVHLILVL